MNKITILLGGLPERKEIKEDIDNYDFLENKGFNQCLDEIETVEITEEDIAKLLWSLTRGRDYKESPWEYMESPEDLAKAIMKLGGKEDST